MKTRMSMGRCCCGEESPFPECPCCGAVWPEYIMVTVPALTDDRFTGCNEAFSGQQVVLDTVAVAFDGCPVFYKDVLTPGATTKCSDAGFLFNVVGVRLEVEYSAALGQGGGCLMRFQSLFLRNDPPETFNPCVIGTPTRPTPEYRKQVPQGDFCASSLQLALDLFDDISNANACNGTWPATLQIELP